MWVSLVSGVPKHNGSQVYDGTSKEKSCCDKVQLLMWVGGKGSGGYLFTFYFQFILTDNCLGYFEFKSTCVIRTGLQIYELKVCLFVLC